MSQFRLTTVALCLLAGAGGVSAQEIRRALPVQPPAPAAPLEIRRALPVLPPSVSPTPAATPVASGSVNDTAHFLAGLPISSDSPLIPLTKDPAWQSHAALFNQAWARLDAVQFAGIRTWEANYLPPNSPVAFYFFSGPDFLYANQFFPNANTYILAGTEPIGPLPEVGHLAGPALSPALQNFEKGLNSVLRFSFFITKDMKSDLDQTEFKGTLPIFYVFLARAGKTISDITFFFLDKNGNPQISTPESSKKPRSFIPGVRVTFNSGPGSAAQTLYYFTTDLSDDGIRAQPGFLKFCAQQNIGDSLLKSASYLMFESGFAEVRNFLLTHSRLIIQDDSGIPLTNFDPAKWDLRLFGGYSGPIDIFKQYNQPQLQALYSASHPAPLGFGIGYRWHRSQSTLILALHK